MQRGWDLNDFLGSLSIYWHLLCTRCCARVWGIGMSQTWALSPLSTGGRELSTYSVGIPPSRMAGGDFLYDVVARAR